MTFVDLGGHRECWCNVDQIVKIEPMIHHGLPGTEASKVVYAVTLSDGTVRGIAKEDFTKIMNVSKARRDG